MAAALAMLLSIPTGSMADQHQEPDYQWPYYCREYAEFLGMQSETEIEICTGLEGLILDIGEVTPLEYLGAYQDRHRATSVAGMLAGAVEGYLAGDPQRAFTALDLADRSFYSSMIARGDENRAYIYAVFFSSAKADLVRGFCEADSSIPECGSVEGFTTAAEMIRDDFAYLDSVDPFTVLYCFLRTDGFTTRIADVLLSAPFNRCIVAQEYGT